MSRHEERVASLPTWCDCGAEGREHVKGAPPGCVHRGRLRLSKAQRGLLSDLAGYPYGEGRVNPTGERTARVLKRHGLIEWAGTGGWVKVTEKGHAEVASGSHPSEEARDE